MDFQMELTAWQTVRGAFDSQEIETSRIYRSASEFAAAFHNVLTGIKNRSISEVMTLADNGTAYLITNGAGYSFLVREIFGDGFDWEYGPRRNMREDTAFAKVLSWYFNPAAADETEAA